MTTMKLNPRNKHGYLQAAISVLIIFSIFCLSYYRIDIQYPSYGHRSVSLLYLANCLSLWVEDIVYFNISLIIFIIMQLANIFYQSKRKNKALSIIASAWFAVVLIALQLLHGEIFDNDSESQVKMTYTCGFYLIVALIAIQFISNLIPNAFFHRVHSFVLDFFNDAPCGNLEEEEQPQHKEVERSGMSIIKKERLEKEMLEKEFRALKAKVEEVERKRAEREKLKQEKEKLAIEIAKLKDMLKKSEESGN